MNVTVVGLGKIGLPMAVQIAGAGHAVVGVDRNPHVVDTVNEGRSPFLGEEGLEDRLAAVVAAGALNATTETAAAVAQSSVVLIVVPLVVDDTGQPDFEAIDDATTAAGNGLTAGTLVSYETTLPLHTTRRRFAPMLEAVSGLTAGSDFFVCHSPERVFSGRVFADLRRYPKLVGGLDPESTRRAIAFYQSVLEFDTRSDLDRENGVWDLGSAEAAELAKLAETTYRYVNIAFANQLALLAEQEGIDVRPVIDAANSQPFSHIHGPGVAVGGHCIPVYPRFLLAEHPLTTVQAALEVNTAMPAYAVDTLEKLLGGLEGRKVVILGASYRGGVKEVAFSGVFALRDLLVGRGASVTVHDPLYDDAELRQLDFAPHHLGDPCDGAIVQTDHELYRTIAPTDLPGIAAIVDGRGVLSQAHWSDVRFHRLGDGTAN